MKAVTDGIRAANLPPELRHQIPPGSIVRVTVETMDDPGAAFDELREILRSRVSAAKVADEEIDHAIDEARRSA